MIFGSSQSTPVLLAVVSYRIVRACNRSGANRAVALDRPKASDRVWGTGLFHKLKLMEFQVRYLALLRLFSVIDGLKCFWTGSLNKTIQLMLVFLKVPFLVLLLSALTILLSTLSIIRHLMCDIN